MSEIDKAFQLLGLSPSASQDEIKEAYRDLCKIWHPDRFPHEPRLIKKAMEKQQEINTAYELLKVFFPTHVPDERTKSAQTQPKPSRKPIINIRMVTIPSGAFRMGDKPFWDILNKSHCSPIHTVTVSSFEMSIYEITQDQYSALFDWNPEKDLNSISYGVGANFPMYYIGWAGAAKFCNKLSDSVGLDRCYDESTWSCDFSKNGYRLPTEAEWEYACRAGTTTDYYTGDRESDLARAGWYVSNSGDEIHPVGQKMANTFGLYDMHGNVWEWCNDLHEKYTIENQMVPYFGLRGGSFSSPAKICRSAYYERHHPGVVASDIGFRVVRRPGGVTY